MFFKMLCKLSAMKFYLVVVNLEIKSRLSIRYIFKKKFNRNRTAWKTNVKEMTMTDIIFDDGRGTHALMFLHVKKGLRVGISLPHESLSTSCFFLILLSSYFLSFLID